MEAVAARLDQSQTHVDKVLSDFLGILRDKRRQDIIDNCHKKVQKFEVACENQMKQQQKATVTNKQQLKERQCEVELLEVKKEAEEKLIATLQEELNHLQAEKTAYLRGPAPGSSEEKTKQLEAEDKLFKQYMATEIEKVQGGWLQVIFTQIDSAKPSSKFFFLFKLDDRRRYVVGDCQPPIHDMDMLVKSLNSTNDLSKFVHSVRKRFKQSVLNK